MSKKEIWQGGVCEGLVVDSEESKQKLREIQGAGVQSDGSQRSGAGENDVEVDGRSLEEIQEDELDFFDWLMLG